MIHQHSSELPNLRRFFEAVNPYTQEQACALNAIADRFEHFQKQLEEHDNDAASRSIATLKARYQTDPSNENLAALDEAELNRALLVAHHSEIRGQVKIAMKSFLVTEAVPIYRAIYVRASEILSEAIDKLRSDEHALAQRFFLSSEPSSLLRRLGAFQARLDQDRESLGSNAGLIRPDHIFAMFGRPPINAGGETASPTACLFSHS